MALDPDSLNDMDRWLLDYLSEHHRGTPNLLRHEYNEEHEDVSRQWVSARAKRLREHGHVRRVHPEASDLEFVTDPQE